jgi:hypothetical protein
LASSVRKQCRFCFCCIELYPSSTCPLDSLRCASLKYRDDLIDIASLTVILLGLYPPVVVIIVGLIWLWHHGRCSLASMSKCPASSEDPDVPELSSRGKFDARDRLPVSVRLLLPWFLTLFAASFLPRLFKGGCGNLMSTFVTTC